jgi:hypothetical protein
MPSNYLTHDAPTADQPTFVVGANLARTSGADAARPIVDTGRVATLGTLTLDPPGFPFGSVVSYALVDQRRRRVGCCRATSTAPSRRRRATTAPPERDRAYDAAVSGASGPIGTTVSVTRR